MIGTGKSYIRDEDGAKMIEIEPGWFVNETVWHLLMKAGVTSCSKKEQD